MSGSTGITLYQRKEAMRKATADRERLRLEAGVSESRLQKINRRARELDYVLHKEEEEIAETLLQEFGERDSIAWAEWTARYWLAFRAFLAPAKAPAAR